MQCESINDFMRNMVVTFVALYFVLDLIGKSTT